MPWKERMKTVNEKGAFNNAKVWKRMIIIIAGAVMNILLGFVMMFAFTVQADSYSSTTISQFQPNAFTANTRFTNRG